MYEELEAYARGKIRGHLQDLLEQEVTEWLGRAESREQALKERKKFDLAFRHNPKAVKTVVENWERLTTYYDFPREHWKHLRTSNVVESPFYGCGSERRFETVQIPG